MSREISFFVPGKSMPAGSKNAFRFGNKISVTDSSGQKGKSWRETIQGIAAQAYDGPLLTGALRVTFMFIVNRPQSHFKRSKGKTSTIVRDGAADWPVVKPDVLKLARAVEDALTDVLWNDDSQIVSELLYKFYVRPEDNERPGVFIQVATMEAPDIVMTDRYRAHMRSVKSEQG